MSNYTQATYFGPKDSLSVGDPNKRAKGTEIDAELLAISTAIATKQDSTGSATTSAAGVVELATSAEAIAGTDTARAVTPAALAAATAVLVYEKTINESVLASTTYQADDHLVTASLDAGTYLVEVYARGSTTGACGMKFRFGGTATIRSDSTLDSCGLVLTYLQSDGVGPADMQSGSPVHGVPGFSEEGTSFLTLAIRAKLVITVAGTVQLEWAQQTATGFLTLSGGSWMAVRRVA
jgi:hypothetical protein